MVCSRTQSLSQPWEWARGWQDVLEPAPTCPTQLCQHSQGQGRELKAGFQSQGEMWVSLRELNPSTASFGLVEPQTLPAQLFSPSRPSLGFPSGGTGQRGAKRGTTKGKRAGSHRCLGQGEHSPGSERSNEQHHEEFTRCSWILQQRIPSSNPTSSLGYTAQGTQHPLNAVTAVGMSPGPQLPNTAPGLG